MKYAAQAGGGMKGVMDITTLWDDYYERVYHWLYLLVRNAEDARDLTDCVFVRAWQRRARYDATQGSVCTWLYTITHNIAYSFLRKKRLLTRSLDQMREDRGPSCAGPAEEHDAVEAKARVWRAVAALPDLERDIMRLHYGEGLTWGEVARRLGISLRDVMYHVSRANVLLRELLRRH
jgi:RNA polymerase sigma factor (sigma-70 family)